MFYRVYLRNETNVIEGANAEITKYKNEELKKDPIERIILKNDNQELYFNPDNSLLARITHHMDKYIGKHRAELTFETLQNKESKGFSVVLWESEGKTVQDLLAITIQKESQVRFEGKNEEVKSVEVKADKPKKVKVKK